MTTQFSTGKHAIAECDRCGFRYKLRDLKELVVKTKKVPIKVCPTCWEPDHPQLLQGMYPVVDPQAVRDPRGDRSLGIGGSRDIYWNWNPVGGPNLTATGAVGTVTVETT